MLSISIRWISDNDTAHIVDDYISDSYIYVNPASGEPLSQPGSDELQVLYELRKLNGDWKVVDGVRAERVNPDKCACSDRPDRACR